MSKRDDILKALHQKRTEMGWTEDLLQHQKTLVLALEAALHEEEERIQYDRYGFEEESRYAAAMADAEKRRKHES